MDYKKVADRLYNNLMIVVSDAPEEDKELALESIDHDVETCVNDPHCRWTNLLTFDGSGFTEHSITEFIRQFKFSQSDQSERMAVFLGLHLDQDDDFYKTELAVRLDACMTILEPAHLQSSTESKENASNIAYEIDELFLQDMYPVLDNIANRVEMYITQYLTKSYFTVFGSEGQFRMLRAMRSWFFGNVPENIVAVRDDLSGHGVIYYSGVELAYLNSGVIHFAQDVEIYDQLLKMSPDIAQYFTRVPYCLVVWSNANTISDLVDLATIMGFSMETIWHVLEDSVNSQNPIAVAKQKFIELTKGEY